jgi:cytosine/adenosine deaminase-related metal-dependent hydrolase
MFKLFRNCKVLQEDLSLKKANLLIQDDLIYDVLELDQEPSKASDTEIDLEGQIIFPGLINSHDHLVDTCWQGLGDTPARNWYEWDGSVRASAEYKSMQRLSVADLYILGMYKNVLSGATTVVDHFPSEISCNFHHHALVSLLEHYYLAHSVSSHQLHWGRNISEEFTNARDIIPFIIHIGQGADKEIQEELAALNRLGALAENTVLVDGCCLEEEQIQLVADKNAALVWLPTASQRIFARQPEIATMLDTNVRLTIGTDSSITGSLGLLTELSAAHEYSKNHLNGRLSARDLIKMVTSDAAKIFGIDKEVGSIEPGKIANFVIFKEEAGKDPFEQFINQRPEDLSMVIHKGCMIMGSEEFRKFSSLDFSLYSEVRLNNSSRILFGRPVQLLERICHKLGKELSFPFFPLALDE